MKGQIERIVEIDEHTVVGWGTLEDGMTFDLPLARSSFHEVGNEVMWNLSEEDCPASHTIIVVGGLHATIHFADQTEEGWEVLHTVVLTKEKGKTN